MSTYQIHGIDTAPDSSKPLLQGLQKNLGLIPRGEVGGTVLDRFYGAGYTRAQALEVVMNWEEVAEALIMRVHREAVGGAPDEATAKLLEEVLAFPGVPRRWQRLNLETPLTPVIPVNFRKGSKTFAYFSTVTTLGTAQDVTLQELRIECFFPMDVETERNAEELAYNLE